MNVTFTFGYICRAGCVGIDDLAILPLTEADFKPGLKCLNIDG